MAKPWLKGASVLITLICISVSLIGCGSAQNSNPSAAAGHADGVSLAPGTPNIPAPIEPPGPAPSANTITLAAKYVALRADANTAAYPTQAEVASMFASISDVWAQCDIRFTLESYVVRVASDDGLPYYPANHSDLDNMRAKYDDNAHALYVKTGTWNRSGNLGADGSNGFSTLPPANPEGVVVEAGVALSALLFSHETGHLIGGLDHTSSTTNLMNHFVTSQTTGLNTLQCDEARATINQYHPAWKR